MSPHQTAKVSDNGSESSGSSVQPVHTAPDSGTERPGGGRPRAHSDAHLSVQHKRSRRQFFSHNPLHVKRNSDGSNGMCLFFVLPLNTCCCNSLTHREFQYFIQPMFMNMSLYVRELYSNKTW